MNEKINKRRNEMNEETANPKTPFLLRVRHAKYRFWSWIGRLGIRLMLFSTRRKGDCNSASYAEGELGRIYPGFNGSDHAKYVGRGSFDRLIARQLMEMVCLFSTHGHSGSSAAYAIATLERLLRFLPLGPLTGEEDEWNEVGTGTFQNKRCSHVFKDQDREAYDSQFYVFFDEGDSGGYTSKDSRRRITFPYIPANKPHKVTVSKGETRLEALEKFNTSEFSKTW